MTKKFSFLVNNFVFSVIAESRNEALAKAATYVENQKLAQSNKFTWAFGTWPNSFYLKHK